MVKKKNFVGFQELSKSEQRKLKQEVEKEGRARRKKRSETFAERKEEAIKNKEERRGTFEEQRTSPTEPTKKPDETPLLTRKGGDVLERKETFFGIPKKDMGKFGRTKGTTIKGQIKKMFGLGNEQQFELDDGEKAIVRGLALAGSIAAFQAFTFPAIKALTHNPKSSIGLTKLTRLPGVGGELVKGKFVSISKTTPAFFRVGNNVKNFALKKSILQKLAATATNPRVMFGILASVLYTSLFWGPNEKGDALITLTIAQRDALRANLFEEVEAIDELIQETLDISAGVPVIGFVKAEMAKFKAGAIASAVNLKAAEGIREEQARLKEQGESDFAKERREGDEAAIERKKAEEERQDIRFEDIREAGEERTEEEEARQDKRFRDIEAKRKETELAEEQAETDKFAKIEENRIARQEEKDRRAVVMQEVWRLRREGKFAEADELELTVIG